jgi:D-tyrosyl-tRNA(Tyr) deacylase
MRALIQRVKEASVYIDGECRSSIRQGILVFLGVKQGDTVEDAKYLSERCSNLRIFEDAEGKMNLSVKDINGSALVISQFTLYADTSRGNRPGFSLAAPPEPAETMYDEFVLSIGRYMGEDRVKTGVFRAMMDVHLVNDGPVTLTLESKVKGT